MFPVRTGRRQQRKAFVKGKTLTQLCLHIAFQVYTMACAVLHQGILALQRRSFHATSQPDAKGSGRRSRASPSKAAQHSLSLAPAAGPNKHFGKMVRPASKRARQLAAALGIPQHHSASSSQHEQQRRPNGVGGMHYTTPASHREPAALHDSISEWGGRSMQQIGYCIDLDGVAAGGHGTASARDEAWPSGDASGC